MVGLSDKLVSARGACLSLAPVFGVAAYVGAAASMSAHDWDGIFIAPDDCGAALVTLSDTQCGR